MKKLRSVSAALAASERHDHRGPERLSHANTVQNAAASAPFSRSAGRWSRARPAAARGKEALQLIALVRARDIQPPEGELTEIRPIPALLGPLYCRR